MRPWVNGDLGDAFEQGLDALLAELSPGWRPPELPEPYREHLEFVEHHRRALKRTQVGSRLKKPLGETIVESVLDVITLDEDVTDNKQLIHPMLKAVERRRVQRHLISAIETKSEHRKVCAVRAWYWSQVSLTYRSVEEMNEGRPTAESRVHDDEVADLRSQYRIACLTAFVSSKQPPTREWLARGFLLVPSHFPPNLHALVTRARQIAGADPDRYQELLAKNDDGTNLVQITFD